MSKRILFNERARSKVLKGATTLKRAVSMTLGPRGYNVAYERSYGEPRIVHDGVTVARETDPKDRFEKLAVDTIKAAAKNAESQTGDGTTTAVVLSHAILKEGFKLIAAGYNAQMLRKGVERATDESMRYLSGIAKPVKDNQVNEVATVAAQNAYLGQVVGAAYTKLGKDAIVTVEDSNTKETYVEYKDGMETDQGFISPYFITDDAMQEASIRNANIVILDRVLNGMPQLVELFKKLEGMKIANDLVIVAHDIQGPVLSTLVLNKVKNGLNILAVKAPGFGDNQKDLLEDLAIVTGGTVIGQGRGFSDLKTTDIGHAARVVASKDTTTFVDGMGLPEPIAERVEAIRQRLENPSVSEYEMERLQERLAKLTTGIAIINVGAPSTTEAEELKERAIDAVGATAAALEQGVVAGGETALLRASKHLHAVLGEEMDDEERAGVKLLQNALKQPFVTLMTNSGYDAGEKRLELDTALTPKASDNLGIDVMDGQVKDMFKAGIIDPVKVPMVALREAASSAAMLLTTGALIVEDEGKDDDKR